jgi:hypothetical protein
MKAILPILLLAVTIPAFGQPAPSKADRPIIYDRNSRQVVPYDRATVSCPHSDMTPPGCVKAEKPGAEKTLRPKSVG